VRCANDESGRGSATVLLLAAAAAVLVLAIGGVTVLAAGLARQRAESAADLAALAGAAALQHADDPYSRAAALAHAQGADVQCSVADEDVLVTAEVPVDGWLQTWVGPAVRARARPGPTS